VGHFYNWFRCYICHWCWESLSISLHNSTASSGCITFTPYAPMYHTDTSPLTHFKLCNFRCTLP